MDMKFKPQRPPKFAFWLLSRISKTSEQLSLMGDFEEEYNAIAADRGWARAKLWYWKQIFQSIPAFIINTIYWSKEMLKNYLKIALRNIKRHKAYSFINIAGLAVGLACCLLILLYVKDQVSFDSFHQKKGQVYRIRRESRAEGNVGTSYSVPAPLAPALKNDFPEIAAFVRIEGAGFIARYQDKTFVERNAILADVPFFEVFTFPLVRGNPETVLNKPGSVVITRKMAEKYFGDENPIGKTLNANSRFDLTVTGVAENTPHNSHLQFDFVIPFEQINTFSGFDYLSSWGAWNFETYLLLQKEASMPEFEAKIKDITKKYRGGESSFAMQQELSLQPLTRVNLDSGNTIRYMYYFSAIAIIILLSSCINFTNLSIAQSSTRAKEVGMRKVVGAHRHQLVKQFLGESLIIALIALPLAVILIQIFLPFLNSLTNSQVKVNYLQNWLYLLGFLGITLIVSVISGSYPAFYISSLKPINSLRGMLKTGLKRSAFRNILIIFQFAISTFLLSSTFVVYNQLSYMKNKDLGFKKEDILMLPILSQAVGRQIENVKNELLLNADILSVTASESFPTGGHGNISAWWEEKQDETTMIVPSIAIDQDFLRTFQIELTQGRDFSKEIKSDVLLAYILNETAVKQLGWEKPIGKQFQIERANYPRGTIIGVVKDFNFDSLHTEIRPLAFVCDPDLFNYLSVRISKNHTPEALQFIEKKFKEFDAAAPFEFYFLDSRIDRIYRAEQRIGKIFNSFSLLAIFIACLGLLGLASFSITRRTKEIGIRKVLGAPLSGIVVLLTKEFTRLVIIANLIAWPAAYFVMHRWLQNFAYRTSISIWIFALSGLATIFIAFLTISFKALRAAAANPVDSLRYE